MVIKYENFDLNKGLDLSRSIQKALNEAGINQILLDGSFGFYSFCYKDVSVDVHCERRPQRSNSKGQYIIFGSRKIPGWVKSAKFLFNTEIDSEKVRKAIEKIVSEVQACELQEGKQEEINYHRLNILKLFKEKVSYQNDSFDVVIGEKSRDNVIFNLETLDWKRNIEVCSAFYSSVRRVSSLDDFRLLEEELSRNIQEERIRVREAEANLDDKLNAFLKTFNANEDTIKSLIQKIKSLEGNV
jgi:hypothetical protein